VELFTRFEAVACPLGLANVDTDQLIPARFMSRSRAQGYGAYLLHDLRFDVEGQPRPDFVLNMARFEGARILVARRNFGTGSSREAAVYALWDYGIRCVIAPSFGDIFAGNAIKNGLLPAVVAEAAIEALLRDLLGKVPPSLTVDLECQTIGGSIPFGIDAVHKMRLLNGWDDIDLTLQHKAAIDAFKARRAREHAWLRPDAPA